MPEGVPPPERSRTRVAINGLGRIGRALFKIALEAPQLEVVALNDLADAPTLAYLLQFDTVRGRYAEAVSVEDDALVVGARRISVLRCADPQDLPWRALDVELVFECSGAFTRREELERHVRAGARVVLLSAPSADEAVPTIVHGVNATPAGAQILSCASCTTNCVAPIVELLGRRIGIRKAVITNVQAYTASQALVDSAAARLRRGRAAAANLVPTTAEAVMATARALSRYAGRLGGVAIRAPVTAGAIADLTLVASRETSVAEVNGILAEEAATPRYAEVLGVTRDPLVSSDIVGDSRAAVVDLALTQVIGGDLVKVMSWYDNEWGHAHQMVRLALALAGRRC